MSKGARLRQQREPAIGAGDLQASSSGWRVWLANPEHPTALLSPWVESDPWTRREQRAACCFGHEPPAPRCECGLYGGPSLVDALLRLRQTAAAIRAGVWTRTPGVPVLAKVTLVDARPSTWWAREPCGALFPVQEMRAAGAIVDELFVASDQCPCWLAGSQFLCTQCPEAAHIADQLGAAFGVPVSTCLPPYSVEDWAARPEWHQRGQVEVASPDAPARWTFGRQLGARWATAIFTAPVPEPGQSVAGEAVRCRLCVRESHAANDARILTDFFDAVEGLPVDQRGIVPGCDLADVKRVSYLILEVLQIADRGDRELPEWLHWLVKSTSLLLIHFASPGLHADVIPVWLAGRAELFAPPGARK